MTTQEAPSVTPPIAVAAEPPKKPRKVGRPRKLESLPPVETPAEAPPNPPAAAQAPQREIDSEQVRVYWQTHLQHMIDGFQIIRGSPQLIAENRQLRQALEAARGAIAVGEAGKKLHRNLTTLVLERKKAVPFGVLEQIKEALSEFSKGTSNGA